MRLQRLLLIIPIVVFSARCGTLFNPQRSAAATEAEKKFTAVKLADLLQEERKNNADTLAREIDTAQRQMTATRDAKLIAIVMNQDRKTALQTAIAERVNELQGADAEINDLLIDIEDAEEALRVDTSLYLIVRERTDPKPDCTTETPPVSTRAASKFALLQADCADLDQFRTTLASRTNSGLLGRTAQTIAITERARIELAALVKKAAAEARQKAAELAAAQKPGQPLVDAATLQRLKAAVEDVTLPSEAQLSAAGISDIRAAAALQWVELQRASIEKVLAAATSGATEPPPGLADHLQIAAVLPSLANQMREGFRYPRVSALVMESQRLRIDGERYQKQLARVDEELALQRAKLRQLRAEWRSLSEATVQLREGSVENALQKYTEAWTGARIPLTATEWKLIGLTHDRALDQSEAALAQWDALVRTPLQALVTSAGSGLKPDEIARLLSVIEMGALTVGVF